MSDTRRHSLADLPHRLRERMANLPNDWKQWREGFRQDPAVLWHSPLVRICGLVVVGIVVLAGVHWFISGLVPADHGTGGEAVNLATLFVACTNSQCRADRVTRQPMDFKDWPLECERCGQATVYRATRCGTCGRWFAVPPGQPKLCPFRAERQAAKAARPDPRPPGTTSDDDEDPW